MSTLLCTPLEALDLMCQVLQHPVPGRVSVYSCMQRYLRAAGCCEAVSVQAEGSGRTGVSEEGADGDWGS